MKPSTTLQTTLRSLLLGGLSLVLIPAFAEGQTTESAASPMQGRVVGTVVEEETGEPLTGVVVRLREMNRSDFTHSDGSFHLEDIPAGSYTLVAERIGYATTERRIDIRSGEVTPLRIEMQRAAVSIPGVVVTGVGRARGVMDTYRPTTVLAGEELDRRLSWSLAQTLAHEPGIAMQSFGPSPAQPVVRGMGGDRVLVLEDGQRTGDLSTTAPDHAVGIDPITAGRVEVVRGPAGLLYGSNALGGVINVIRDEVPRELPESLKGSLSLQGESVNDGTTAAAELSAPLGERIAVRGEGSARFGNDIRTPLGRLEGTESRGHNAALGLSWVGSWGFFGGSVRDYALDHSVPGEFGGELIPGAHPGGAEIESRRRLARLKLGHFSGIGPFSSLEVQGNVIQYDHREIEGELASGERVIGTRFDQLTTTLSAMARHDHDPDGVRREGAVGVFAMHRDLLTGGSFPGTRDATELNLALFAYEELDFSPFRLQIGARFDWIRSTPNDTRPIRRPSGDAAVDERTFGDLSGSLAALYELRPGWTLGASVARGFRSPSVPELFSDGPHLADFSYDVGNPQLDREVGLGTDLFLRVARSGLNLEVSLFRNDISNFIHYRPTGEIDPRLRRFPLFLAVGADALYQGADGRVQWEVVPDLVLDATVSYVRAEYKEDGEPIPTIPPLNGGIRARYEGARYFATLGWDGAARQDRVPHPIPNPVAGEPDLIPEHPTPGYGLVSVGSGIRWEINDQVHSITVNLKNAFDSAWRDHLSRSKEVAPEPGRNLQVLYRVNF